MARVYPLLKQCAPFLSPVCDRLEMHVHTPIKAGKPLGMTTPKLVTTKSVLTIIREAIEAKNALGQDEAITVEDSESDEDDTMIDA